jgi:uncharacterized protein with HEPN domain
MSAHRRDQDYLSDIFEAMDRILSYTSDLDYDRFMEDKKTQDAVLRNLQVMGEATKKLSQRLREVYPGTPWRQIAGMRDKVVHEYFGINYDIVWAVVSRDIPDVFPQIEAILTQEGGRQ